MFTANSMNCLCEALGMALPGNGTFLAAQPRAGGAGPAGGHADHAICWKMTSARWTSSRRRAIDNAMALDMAMGGSTNTVLHTLAIAHEAGIDYPISRINEISRRTPNICKVSPSSHYHVRGCGTRRAGSAPSCTS